MSDVLGSARTLWQCFNKVVVGSKIFPFLKTKEPAAMNTNNGRNHLYDVVNDFDVAMLVTYTADAIHARPMAIARIDDGIGVYLVTDINSLKIDEISVNPHAVLTFQSARKFASVSGELTVLGDRQLIEKMWKEAWKVWFPDGKSDPNIALLKFTAHEGEYWDNAGLQGLKYVYDAAKAYVAGETPKTDDAQHAKVRL
jgi:general stress protein 26